MALTKFTTTGWVPGVTPTTANMGFPDDGNIDGGFLGRSGNASGHYGVDDTYGPYYWWDGLSFTDNNTTVSVSNGDIASYLSADGRAVRVCYFVEFRLVSADGKTVQHDGFLTGNNPDIRWVIPGSYTGNPTDGYTGRGSGRHVVLNPVYTAAGTVEGPESLRIPLNRAFSVGWFVVRNSSDNYDLLLLIDGQPVLKKEGLISFTHAGNRMNEIYWDDVGNGLDTTHVQIRLYGDHSGVETFASGGWSNFEGTADADLPRQNDSRVFSGAFYDFAWDGNWVSNLTNCTPDLDLAHAAYVPTRGYNAFPHRLDFTASGGGNMATRETALNWPTRDGRCALLWVVRPSNAASGVIGCNLLARVDGDGDVLAGIGWASNAGGSVDLLVKYPNGLGLASEDTSINLDIDATYAIVLSFNEGALGVSVNNLSLNANNANYLQSFVSSEVTGVPANGFGLRMEFESGNIIAAPGQFQHFGTALLPRIPWYLESSYTDSSVTIAAAGADDGTFRRADRIALAAFDAFGPAGIISQIETIGRLTADGLLQPGSCSPGFIAGQGGLSMRELVENAMNGNPGAFAAAGKSLQLFVIDGTVNGIDQDTLEITQANTELLRAACNANGVDYLDGKTASPPVYDGEGSTDWTEAQAADVEARNAWIPTRPGPRWQFDLITPNGGESGATDAYWIEVGNTEPTEDVHPIKSIEWHFDMFENMQFVGFVESGGRLRDRSRSR